MRKMLRNKKIIIVSHCVLNQNSVVCPLARAKGAFKFVTQLVHEGIGIIQLPCPELRYLGIDRKPMDKFQYDTLEYRNFCKSLVLPIVEEIVMYVERGYSFIGVIGINESPTCSITKNMGILMEELFKELSKHWLKPDFIEVPSDYDDEKDCNDVCSKIISLIMSD
jgi:predicted secreted protein